MTPLFTAHEGEAGDGSGDVVMHISAPGFEPFTWRTMNPTHARVIAEIARRQNLPEGEVEVRIIEHE